MSAETKLSRATIQEAPDRRAGASRGPGRRAFPRYAVTQQLVASVTREGTTSITPGECVELGEGGLRMTVDLPLIPGEVVTIELPMENARTTLCAQAVVRYTSRTHFGVEFLELTPGQRLSIQHHLRRFGPGLPSLPPWV